MNQKSLDKQDWEEALWEIIGEVKIPSVLKGHDEMSLFDVCMRGTQDEEGIWLVEKLKSFIQSELDRQRKSGYELAIKDVLAEIKPLILSKENLKVGQDTINLDFNDGVKNCINVIENSYQSLLKGKKC